MLNVEKHIQKVKDAPLQTFTQFITDRDQVSVIYKFDTPLYDNEVLYNETRKFSLFQLGSLSSLKIMFGYVFVFPFKTFTLKDKYFIIRRPSCQNLVNFTGVELAYQSKYINVYSSEDGATLVTANGLNKVILTEIVRKSKKAK